MFPVQKLASGVAAGLLAMSLMGVASAISADEYATKLESAGFTVEVDAAAVDFPTLSIDGTAVNVSKPDGSARVVLLDYGSRAELDAEWTAVAGQPPVPKTADAAFVGKALYWNNDSVLVVDFRGDNDRVAAQGAAAVFLGGGGTGGLDPGAPTTGNSPMSAPDGGAFAIQAGLLLALAGGLGLATAQRFRRR